LKTFLGLENNNKILVSLLKRWVYNKTENSNIINTCNTGGSPSYSVTIYILWLTHVILEAHLVTHSLFIFYD
jgi:hypothetical protein